MKFAEQLQPLVESNGGASAAAEICGVSRQTINLWLRGSVPNLCTQAGALFLLGIPSYALPTKTLYISTTPFPKPLMQRPTPIKQPIYGGFLRSPKP